MAHAIYIYSYRINISGWRCYMILKGVAILLYPGHKDILSVVFGLPLCFRYWDTSKTWKHEFFFFIIQSYET